MFCKISLPPRNSFYCFAFLQKKLDIQEEDQTQTIEDTQKKSLKLLRNALFVTARLGFPKRQGPPEGLDTLGEPQNNCPEVLLHLPAPTWRIGGSRFNPHPQRLTIQQLQRHVSIARSLLWSASGVQRDPTLDSPFPPKILLKLSLVPGGKSCLSGRVVGKCRPNLKEWFKSSSMKVEGLSRGRSFLLPVSLFYLWLVFVAYGKLAWFVFTYGWSPVWSFLHMVENWFGCFTYASLRPEIGLCLLLLTVSPHHK